LSRIRDQASYVEVQHTRIVDIFSHVLYNFLVKFALTALMQVIISQDLQELNDFLFIGWFGSFCNVVRKAVKRVILQPTEILFLRFFLRKIPFRLKGERMLIEGDLLSMQL
jgi:hypothetical protein